MYEKEEAPELSAGFVTEGRRRRVDDGDDDSVDNGGVPGDADVRGPHAPFSRFPPISAAASR